MLTPERWAKVEELFHRAAECAPERRTRLLDQACCNDPELRREVEALLSSDRSAGHHVKTAVREGLTAFTFPLVGQVVSHYRILDGLGVGGMGLVYRAEDLRLGRWVALKFLPEESAKDPAALGRFEREARSASALEHPNICPIYEFGEHEGRPFLVMQLLEGHTLREVISNAGRGKPSLPLSKVFDFAIQIADALEAAHRKGIIHRDIKPANIFITNECQAKVLDFGLAKLARARTALGEKVELNSHDEDGRAERKSYDAVPPTSPDLFLNRTDVAMGTAGYMSPEQVQGKELDARTDLFSFGLVLHEIATGQRAFPGDTGPVLQQAILNQEPSPARQLNPSVPAKLEMIIHKALEKGKEARYQSAAEMRADLEILRRDIESGRAARWGKLAAIAAILLTISTILWVAKRRPPSLATLSDLKLRQLTIHSAENRVTSGAISPDGKYLAYTDRKGMYIKRIETGVTQKVPQPGTLKEDLDWEITPYTWFLDGTKFLAQAHPASEGQTAWSSQTTTIWLVSVVGGAPQKLRDNAVAWSVSPDGSLVAFGTNKGRVGDREIWLMGPNGEQGRKLFDTGEDSSIGGFIWTADGQRGIYVSSEANNDGNRDTLVSRDLKGGSPTTLLAPSEMSTKDDLSWLPDGRLLYSVRETQTVGDTCNYWVERLDARTGNLLQKPRRLTNWSGFCMSYTGATADSKQIAFLESSSRGTVYVGGLRGGGTEILAPRHFTLDESSDVLQDWTADSNTIIFTSNRAGTFGIYKQSLTEDSPETIYSGAVVFGQTRVSPDGKWLIGIHWANPGNLSGPAQVMRVPIGGGQPELIFSALDSGISCARPPSSLCVTAEPTEDRKQATVSAFDPIKGRGRELTRFELDPNQPYLFCEISPEGKRLAIARSRQGPIEIRPLNGQPRNFIHVEGLNHMATLNWAADGKGLFVNSGINGGTAIFHVNLQGHTNLLWENNRGMENIARPSPDGQHLAIQVWPTTSNIWMMENF